MTSSPGAVFYSVRCLFWIISEGIFICSASLFPVAMVWVLTSRLDAPERAPDRIRWALCCLASPLSLRHWTWGRVEKNIQIIVKKERKERREATFRGSGNMSSRREPQPAGSAVPETIVQRMWKSYWRIKLIRRESLVLPCGMNIPYMEYRLTKHQLNQWTNFKGSGAVLAAGVTGGKASLGADPKEDWGQLSLVVRGTFILWKIKQSPPHKLTWENGCLLLNLWGQ